MMTGRHGAAQGISGVIVAARLVVDLTDLVFRRLPIAISGRLTRSALTEIAALAAEGLSWSDDERERQLEDLCRIASQRHGIDVDG